MALAAFVYIVVATFVVGNAYRIWRVARMPAHLRWELYPMPRGTDAQQQHGGSYFEDTMWWTKPRHTSIASELGYILREVLTFTTLRKRNRPLWVWSWLMHIGLYGWVVTLAVTILAAIAPFWLRAVALAAALSSGAGLAGTTGLMAHRLADKRIRSCTRRADFFNLGLIGVLFASAALVPFVEGATKDLVTFAHALLHGASMPAIGWPAALHIAIVSVFAAYYPATHMTHAYMKFFTYHRVRWDDAPIAENAALDHAMRANVQRPISWAAPHIASGSRGTWADVVAGRRS